MDAIIRIADSGWTPGKKAVGLRLYIYIISVTVYFYVYNDSLPVCAVYMRMGRLSVRDTAVKPVGLCTVERTKPAIKTHGPGESTDVYTAGTESLTESKHTHTYTHTHTHTRVCVYAYVAHQPAPAVSPQRASIDE